MLFLQTTIIPNKGSHNFQHSTLYSRFFTTHHLLNKNFEFTYKAIIFAAHNINRKLERMSKILNEKEKVKMSGKKVKRRGERK